jgi:hypothetical protein
MSKSGFVELPTKTILAPLSIEVIPDNGTETPVAS